MSDKMGQFFSKCRIRLSIPPGRYVNGKLSQVKDYLSSTKTFLLLLGDDISVIQLEGLGHEEM